MLDSINIGIAGMHAFSDGLKTISNNVANMNTPGFKATTSSFSDLLYTGNSSLGSLRSGNYQQFGSGVSYSNTMLNFSAGTLQTTTGDLDLAISGHGFFVLTNANGEKVYLRTGQFELKDGNIVRTGTGEKLMVRSSSGEIVSASTTGLEVSQPKASTAVTFSGNAASDSSADIVVQSVNVIDALGGTHALSVTFSAATTQAGTLNQKTLTVKDEKGNVLKTGTVSWATTTPATADAASATMVVTVTAVGGKTSTVKLDFSATTGYASAVQGTSAVSAKPADGYAMGTISAVVGTADGKLQINYTNGQNASLGDIVLADFSNVQDLQSIGGGLYHYGGTDAPFYGASAKDGLGKVTPKSLEGSNVNLSDEFGELILVQRGFQASSQIISTANEMLGHVFELRSQR